MSSVRSLMDDMMVARRGRIVWMLILIVVMFTVYFGNEITNEWFLSASSQSFYRQQMSRSTTNTNTNNNNNNNIDSQSPTYIQLCHSILSPETEEMVIIQETENFCRNTVDFIPNIVQIFTSELLHISWKHPKIFYQHGCDKYYDPTSSDDGNTVWMKFPSHVMNDDDDDDDKDVQMTLDEVTDLCTQFLSDDNPSRESSSSSSILYQILWNNPKWNQLLVEKMIRTIRLSYESFFHPPQESQQNRRRLLLGSETDNDDPKQITSPSLVLSNRRNLLANPNSDAPDHDGLDTTIIFVNENNNDDDRTLPLNSYMALIPRSTTNVYIMTTSTNGVAVELQAYLQILLPRASIQTLEESMIWKDSNMKLILSSPTFICTSESCAIPALARIQTTILLVPQQSDSWMNQLNRDRMHPTTLWIPDSTLVSTQHVTSTSTEFTSPEACAHARGRAGLWIQDWNMASQLQYKSPLDHIFGFADVRYIPSEDFPYRLPSTHAWQDDVCPITIFNTNDSICQLLESNGISRVLLVGDFVTMNQAYSLWKLFEQEDSPKPMMDREPNWEREISCANSHKIIIQYIRNDKMAENDQPVDLPNKIANCDDVYCYKWKDKYLDYYNEDDGRKSLVIFNFGAHFYSEESYTTRMTEFLNLFQQDTRMKERIGKDLLFYRTTSPGHEYCNRMTANLPFENFQEYRKTITWKYSWDLHDGFNDIADRMIRQFNQQLTNSPSLMGRQPIHLLDVYPMTVLRRDGHVGGKDCRDCFVGNDCFYYSLPGPPDWWNHLLLTNLQDLSTNEN